MEKKAAGKVTKLDTGQAKSILEKARAKRRQECLEEIKEVLQKYRCSIQPSVTIVSGQISSSITIVALED